MPRLIVEASWGLCRVYGYSGDLARALPAATEGIDIATAAGDEWIASLVRVSLGAGLTMAGRYEAARSIIVENQMPIGVATCDVGIGQALRKQDNYEEALANLDKARLVPTF